MKKVRRMRLAAIERAEKMLSESHKFYPIWFKYSFTVILQSTIKFDVLILSQPSALIAESFSKSEVTRTRLIAFERAVKMLSECHEFHTYWLKYSITVILQCTVKVYYFGPQL